MELKKSYRGLVLWMIFFLAGLFALMFVPSEDSGLLLRLVMNWTTLGVASLALLIRIKQAVYWYNGTTFEEAVKAGEERRKQFAQKHLNVFGYFAGVFLLYSLIAQGLGLPFWIDIVLGTVGLMVAAFRTIPFKL